MNKLYKENGLLSEHGQSLTSPLGDALSKILSHEEMRGMSENELRVLGGALQKIVGDTISDKIQSKKSIASKFARMSDEQFEGYLKAKYGERWILCSLTDEEFERIPRFTSEEIEASFKEANSVRVQSWMRMRPRPRFR